MIARQWPLGGEGVRSTSDSRLRTPHIHQSKSNGFTKQTNLDKQKYVKKKNAKQSMQNKIRNGAMKQSNKATKPAAEPTALIAFPPALHCSQSRGPGHDPHTAATVGRRLGPEHPTLAGEHLHSPTRQRSLALDGEMHRPPRGGRRRRDDF